MLSPYLTSQKEYYFRVCQRAEFFLLVKQSYETGKCKEFSSIWNDRLKISRDTGVASLWPWKKEPSVECYLVRIVLELDGKGYVWLNTVKPPYSVNQRMQSWLSSQPVLQITAYLTTCPYQWTTNVQMKPCPVSHWLEPPTHPVFAQAFVKKLEISKRVFLWTLDPNMTNVSWWSASRYWKRLRHLYCLHLLDVVVISTSRPFLMHSAVKRAARVLSAGSLALWLL
jgi:hypothetical protein